MKPRTQHLHDALAAGEDAGACLAHLLPAWASLRAPAVAEVIERISERHQPVRRIGGKGIAGQHAAWLALAAENNAADRPTLLAHLTVGRSELAHERMVLVRKWPADPRTASALLRLLGEVPYPSQKALPFWELLLETLADLRDPRVMSQLPTALAWPGSAKMQQLMRKRVAALAEHLGAVRHSEPSAEERAAIEALTARWGQQANAKKKSPDSEDEFLDRIADDPDDDELRRVFGDWLTDRGDPRGELIALSYAASRDERRVAALARKHARGWLGPLADVVDLPRCGFEHGFLAVCAYRARYTRALRPLAGARAWTTVRELHFTRAGQGSATHGLLEVLRHPTARRLRGLFGIDAATAVELARGHRPGVVEPLPLIAMGCSAISGRALDLDDLRGLPELRSLVLTSSEYAGLPSDWLERAPFVGRLERLEVQSGWRGIGTMLALLAAHPLRVGVVAPSLDPASGLWRYVFTREEGGLALTVCDDAHLGAAALPIPSAAASVSERGSYVLDELAARFKELPPGRVMRVTIVAPPALREELRGSAKALEKKLARSGVGALTIT